MRYHLKYQILYRALVFLILFFTPESIIQAGARHNREQIWQVSSGLGYAYHQCYDVPAWNANGSRLLLRGKKGAVYLVKGFGSQPKPLKLLAQPFGYIQWDQLKPEVIYYGTRDQGQQTVVCSYNLASRETKVLLKVPGSFLIAPAHPDGEHLLFYSRNDGGGVALIYSLQTRKILNIPLPGKVSRVRFTKHADLSIFCNLENADEIERTSWILDAYTGAAKQLVSGVAQHPDWQSGGNLFSYFENDQLCVVNRKGEQVKFIADIFGFQSWSDDGKSLVIDVTYKPSKYYGLIVICDSVSGELKALAEPRFLSKKETGPQSYPHFSPDKTKVVFNSNNYGKNQSQVYVVKVKQPEMVKNLRLGAANNSLELSWSPITAKEVRSLQINKIYLDGRRIKQYELDSRQTKCNIKNEENLKRIEVIAKEFSGMESEPAYVELVGKSVSWLGKWFSFWC